MFALKEKDHTKNERACINDKTITLTRSERATQGCDGIDLPCLMTREHTVRSGSRLVPVCGNADSIIWWLMLLTPCRAPRLWTIVCLFAEVD